MENEKEFLTTDEAARRFRVTRRTVCRWCVDGKVEAVRVQRRWFIAADALPHLLLRSDHNRALDILQANELVRESVLHGMQLAANAIYRRFGPIHEAHGVIANAMKSVRA